MLSLAISSLRIGDLFLEDCPDSVERRPVRANRSGFHLDSLQRSFGCGHVGPFNPFSESAMSLASSSCIADSPSALLPCPVQAVQDSDRVAGPGKEQEQEQEAAT